MMQIKTVNNATHYGIRGEWLVREISELVIALTLIAALVYLLPNQAVPEVYKGSLAATVTMAATFYFTSRVGGKGPGGTTQS